MQEYNLTIQLPQGETVNENIPEGTTFETLAFKYQQNFKDKIVLAMLNNRLQELNKPIPKDGKLEFLTMTGRDGKRAYRRSVTILLQKAVYNLYKKRAKVRVCYSLGDGYYCELEGMELTREMLTDMKEENE